MPPTTTPKGSKRARANDELNVVNLTEPEAVAPPAVADENVLENPSSQAEVIFHDYDFTNFWVNCKYSRDMYVEPSPDNNEVTEVEETLGYRLPKAYIELCQKTQNGGLVKKMKISTNKPWPHNRVYISSIFSIGHTKTYSLAGSMGSKFWPEEWGYPTTGVYFADCPSGGHDMVCLDYSKCGPTGEPQVVHIDQEGNYRKTVIAKDFETFIRRLEYSESMGIPNDDDDNDNDDNSGDGKGDEKKFTKQFVSLKHFEKNRMNTNIKTSQCSACGQYFNEVNDPVGLPVQSIHCANEVHEGPINVIIGVTSAGAQTQNDDAGSGDFSQLTFLVVFVFAWAYFQLYQNTEFGLSIDVPTRIPVAENRKKLNVISSVVSTILPEINVVYFAIFGFIIIMIYKVAQRYGESYHKNENYFLRIKIIAGLSLILNATMKFLETKEDGIADLKLAIILACCTNGLICFLRNYKLIVITEFLVVGYFGYWKEQYIFTFPFIAMTKMVASFIIFVLEVFMYIPLDSVVKLRYLLFFLNSPCHSKIEAGGVKFHYSFDQGGNLVASNDTSSSLAVYNTCVGLAMQKNFKAVNNKLSGIGKCHEWSVVSTCLLSAHKYMTYSFTMYQRWSTWTILGINILGVVLEYIYDAPFHPYIIDLLFLIWCGVDIYNCLDGQLQEDYQSMKKHLKVPPVFEYVGIGMYGSLVYLLWLYRENLMFVRNYGFVLFLLIGFSCHCLFQGFVDWWMPRDNQLPEESEQTIAQQRPSTENKKKTKKKAKKKKMQ